MALLIERYAPQSLAQIPQPGISVLRNCVKKQLEGKLSGKAVFIYGPTGCGKTTAVKCLARELGLELFELNASDFRSSKDLEVTLMPAVSQSSLWAASRLILLDELDGLDPSEDGGAVGTILAAIKLSKHPIVLVANEPWTAQLAPLREKAILIEFQKIPIKIIFNTLKNICQKEGTAYDMQALALLAQKSSGDLRSALVDLELLLPRGVALKDVQELASRDASKQMSEALFTIFKQTDPNAVVGAFDKTGEELTTSMLWLDENLPREYLNPADLARAYEALSRADVHLGRIRRSQHWRLLNYAGIMMTSGVAVAKSSVNAYANRYTKTKRLFRHWQLNRQNSIAKSIASKFSALSHLSTRRAFQTLPFLKRLLSSAFGDAVAKDVGLTDEEVGWLLGKAKANGLYLQ